MADISGPALEKAKAKVLSLIPSARVETKVRLHCEWEALEDSIPASPRLRRHTRSRCLLHRARTLHIPN